MRPAEETAQQAQASFGGAYVRGYGWGSWTNRACSLMCARCWRK